jgi:hypothetical protein
MRHANADAASEARDVSKGGPPRRRPIGSTYAAVSPSSRPWPIGSKVVMTAGCRGCMVVCGGVDAAGGVGSGDSNAHQLKL